jgi:Uma2 family endonuclease
MTAIVSTPVPLESGDQMSRTEFHRRYTARPDLKKAELVEGVVYVASPVRILQHSRPHARVMMWLSHYVAQHPEVELDDNGSVILDDENEVQPDAFLTRTDVPSGASLDDAGYFAGPPDLIVEVAASSASYDLRGKKTAYERHGVREYIVWDVESARVHWFVLENGRYREVAADKDGMIESVQFSGLRLDVDALLNGDRKRLVAAVR